MAGSTKDVELCDASDRDRLLLTLDTKFKPMFDEYDDKGVPLSVLRDRFEDAELADTISKDKIDYFFLKADTDADGHLDYNEFVRVVTSDKNRVLTSSELTAFQKLVRGAVSSVVPKGSRTVDGEDYVDDYLSHYSCKPPPIFMVIISIAEVIIFIVYALELADSENPVTATTGVALYSPLVYNPSRRYEAWRFLTYMFIHQGYTHLIFNMIFQLFLGIPLEMVHKWWRMMIVYSLGVIAGSLCHSIFDTSTFLAGASGGCYSLIGAHFAIIIMNWKEMTHDWMSGPIKFLSSAPVRLVIWTLFAVMDTGLAIYNRYFSDQANNVGYAAHFGGALCGILIGIPVLKNIDVKPWEKILWWVSLIVYLVLVIFAILWNVFYPNFPEQDRRPCCPKPY